MTRGLTAVAGLAVVLVGAVVGGVATPAAAAPPYPAPDGRCVDQTGVLGPRVCARVSSVLLQEADATSDEIAVAVVPTTGDASIETWSTGLFNTWGVGRKGKDNGVLLVVALDDHRVRLVTGRGMAGRLSDGQAAEIVDGTITPRFAQGQYAAGILAGLDEVRRREGHPIPAGNELIVLLPTAGFSPPDSVAGGGQPVGGGQPPSDASDSRGSGEFAWFLLPAGLVFIVVLALVLRVRGRRGIVRGRRGIVGGATYHSASASHTFWGGGDSSGSSGSSFGGGGSDGGGASGSW